MMKTLKPLLILFFTLILTACGDGDSSSEDSSADVTVTTDSGATVSFASDEVTVGEVATAIYNLGGDEFTATIFWGDNTTSRVRGSGSINHIYRSEGTVIIAIQVDGFEAIRVGNIEVIEIQQVSQTESADSSLSSSSPPVDPVVPTPPDSVTFPGPCTPSDIAVTFITVQGQEYRVILDTISDFIGDVIFSVLNVSTDALVEEVGISPGSSICEASAVLSLDGIDFEFTPDALGQYTVTARP